jgi:segregation and condensation protein A
MADYKVKIDIYSGPLDLLLYLIRRDEVDIYDIPIAHITAQYLEYVELIKSINIDKAAEFLVMAASLMEVKSAMLIPRHEAAEGDEEEDDLSDPRLELVHLLLEYKKFKDASSVLSAKRDRQSLRFPRSLANLNRLEDDQKREQQEYDLEGLQIWDLYDAFNQLMKATFAGHVSHEVVQDYTPIDLYETDILDRAQRKAPLSFGEAFAVCKTRSEMGGMFLALLELMRQRLVRIEQEETFGTIYIFPLTDEPAELAVAHAIFSDSDQLPTKATQAEKAERKELNAPTELPDNDARPLTQGATDEPGEETD